MTEQELIRELNRLLDATAGIEGSLPLRRELWQLVGDPRGHTTKTYSERVDAISERFHFERKLALRKIRESGLYDNYFPVLRESARGLYSLFCLRLAGVLYAAHIVAIVDVRHHQANVIAATQRLPAFA